MAQSWRSKGWRLGLASSLAIAGALAEISVGVIPSKNYAFAQIKPDATLGAERSVVKSNLRIKGLPSDQIEGGAIRGTNLFHSFREFNISEGHGAYFTNPTGIENILSRVTGKNSSNIQGTLGVVGGNANLFLINPNGIIFGPNARLDVSGSFLASTASSLDFTDGIEFSATNPQAPPLLRVNVPIGLQFGANPGRILVQGSGHNLRYSTNAGSTIRTDRPGLQVQPSETLALVGGDVALEGSNLRAESGRIELGSVAESSLVSLTPTDSGFALGYSGVQKFRDIQLSKQASADTSGEGSGEIQVQGRRLSVSDGSAILSITEGSKSGGSLTVNASDSVELIGESADGQYASSLSMETQGAGSSGDLRIATGKLIGTEGAYVSNYTYSGGRGGNLTVQASESVEMIGTGLYASGLYAETVGTGDAGNLTVTTGRLILRDGAQVRAVTYGFGSAGTLTVTAEDIELIGDSSCCTSGLFAQSESEATGAGGNLTIDTKQLTVWDGAQVSVSTFGEGPAGTLTITAQDIELRGISAIDNTFSSGLFAQANPRAVGAGGNLTIDTRQLFIRDGAQVGAGTFGEGQGGVLSVTASDLIELTGRNSGLLSQTEGAGDAGNLTIGTKQLIVQDQARVSVNSTSSARGAGNAGNLTIKVGQLVVRDGAQVGAGTFGEGKGGDLTVNAQDVQLSGASADGRVASGLAASARPNSTGDAGDLTINTNTLLVQDGARVTVESLGTGTAGIMALNAHSIRLDDNAILTANTQSTKIDPNSEQATIKINSQDLIMSGTSNITTDAKGTATGGNITIDTDLLVALENSDISANALEGPGGRVTINAQGIFGTEFREEETPQSDITATSELGPQFSGTVDISTPDVDLSKGLVALPEAVVDAGGLIAQGCPGEGPTASRFTVTGRGGLPPSPDEVLNSDDVLVGLVRLDSKAETRSGAVSSKPLPKSTPAVLEEAKGWVVNDKGEVTLTAQAPPSGACDAP